MSTESLRDEMQGERTHLSRTNRSVITADARARFEAAAHAIWPLLFARLHRAGASPEDAEDVAQEALLRAWDRGLVFVDDGDLLRWCTVVARRSYIDRVRRQSRLLDLGELASDSACVELEAVELRHVLGTVNTAMARLTEQERDSLRAAPAGVRRDRATQVRTAVARHRARHRLRLLVGPFAALGAQAVRVLRRGAPAAIATGALAAVALTVTLAVPPDRGTATVPPGHAFGSGPAAKDPGAGSGPVSSAPMVRVSSVRPASGQTAAPTQIAAVDGPSGTGLKVHQRPGSGKDSILCLDDSSLGRVCVPPLSDDSAPIHAAPHPPAPAAAQSLGR